MILNLNNCLLTSLYLMLSSQQRRRATPQIDARTRYVERTRLRPAASATPAAVKAITFKPGDSAALV